jgi:hypothetical protein
MSGLDESPPLPIMSPSISDVVDWHQITTFNEERRAHERIESLEDAVRQMLQYEYLSVEKCRLKFYRRNDVMRRRLNRTIRAVNQIEEWKGQFLEWADALMAMLWGRPAQHTAARVNALQGWMEESPV